MNRKGKYPARPGLLLLAIALLTNAGWRADIQHTAAQIAQNIEDDKLDRVKHLNNFDVIEFRRYDLKEGARETFARYFEAFFPEAFQQLGAMPFGQFFERKYPMRFTWIRGFKSMDARAIANSEFYYGPLWKEHRRTMNSLMVDVSNVLLLRPLNSKKALTVLPAVDPVTEPNGARGVVIAQIFAVKADSVDAFAQQAEPTFAGYRAAGAREAGILVTLDVPNNFPQLPVRTDGPYLVWLGILKDNQTLDSKLDPLVQRSLRPLAATNLLRSPPEVIVLEPTHRSRLRWLEKVK